MRVAQNHLHYAQDAAQEGADSITDGLRTAKQRGLEAGESLRDAASSVAGVAQDRLEEVRENLTELGHTARDTVYASAEELRERAEMALQEGKARLQGMEQTVEGRIRAMPIQSVLMAAGVGLLIGLFMRRR
jgi:ElaB/YqjD/DUF883 family membrane-anchored ribosome-binding protein